MTSVADTLGAIQTQDAANASALADLAASVAAVHQQVAAIAAFLGVPANPTPAPIPASNAPSLGIEPPPPALPVAPE